MMNMSVASIRSRLKKLVERGWMSEHTNPEYKSNQHEAVQIQRFKRGRRS